jgi:hypothetical protein
MTAMVAVAQLVLRRSCRGSLCIWSTDRGVWPHESVTGSLLMGGLWQGASVIYLMCLHWRMGVLLRENTTGSE